MIQAEERAHLESLKKRKNPMKRKKSMKTWQSVVKELSKALYHEFYISDGDFPYIKVTRDTAKTFFNYGVKKGDVPAWYIFPADVGQALIKIRGKFFQINITEEKLYERKRSFRTNYYIVRTR